MEIMTEDTGSWSEKVNFLDDNAVFVGYDLSQDCCENADWYITDKIVPYSYDDTCDDDKCPTPDVSEYSFDPDFFREVPSGDLDDGGMVAFKLVAKDKPDLYLHLFNCRNDYCIDQYGHGFKVEHGGEAVREGCL